MKKRFVTIRRENDEYFIETEAGKIKVALDYSSALKFLEGFFFEGEGKQSTPYYTITKKKV